MTRTLSLLGASLMLTATLLATSACAGTGTERDSAATPEPVATSPAPEPSPTGSAAPTAEPTCETIIPAATVEDFDSVGWTVGGRKIEIIKEDDQFNPQVGLQKAKKLVESDKVDMIVGVQASNVALAVLNYAKQQKAFYIVSGAGTDAITWDRYPYLFRTSISAYQLSTPMANWVYDNLVHLARAILLEGMRDHAVGRHYAYCGPTDDSR